MLAGFKTVFAERKPIRFCLDKGSEFINRSVKQFMKESNVYMFTTQNVHKMVIGDSFD